MKAIIHTAFLLVFLFDCCKSKKSAATADKTNPKSTEVVSQTATTTTTTPANTPATYRLIISFISKGEGTDRSAKEMFGNFIADYPQKVSYETAPWGREGEVDYCLKLAELSEKGQIEFVDKIKKLLTNSELVNILENKSCIHKH